MCWQAYAARNQVLRLPTPVTLGSRFGDGQVCWLGGWTSHRFAFVVMVVRVSSEVRASLRKNLLMAALGVMNQDGATRQRQKEMILTCNCF